MKIRDVSCKLNIYDTIELLNESSNDFKSEEHILDDILFELREHPNYHKLENDISDLIMYVGNKFFVKGLKQGALLQNLLLASGNKNVIESE